MTLHSFGNAMADSEWPEPVSGEGEQPEMREQRPLVVALVLNWNGYSILYESKSILGLCLSSLIRARYSNLKIILADAQSQDDSVAFTSREFKSVTVIRVPNEGTAPSYNSAMKYALDRYPTLDYILMLNNDLIFDTGFLDKMVNVAEFKEGVGIVGCRLLYPNGTIQHCGSHDSITGEPTMIRHQTKSGVVDSVVGAVFLVKVAVIRKVGLFDDRFAPFGHDDVDYCQRAKAAGYDTFLVADTKVIHLESYTLRGHGESKWSESQISHSLRRGHYLYSLKWHKLRLPLLLANRLLANTIGLVVRRSPRIRLRRMREAAVTMGIWKATLWHLLMQFHCTPCALPRTRS